MGNVYFITGFPGFIATQLLKELIKEDDAFTRAYVLVLPSFQEKGGSEARRLTKELGIPEQAIAVVAGDITKPGLGISGEPELKTVTHVFHLAAIYDLAVPKEIAYNVNVKGTSHVNDWVKGLPLLTRYVYFSTAYVAGTREGKLLETELVTPHSFKNFYEETKYEAEVLVNHLKQEVPVTIIRPGIVKGHSVTGETVKFDGPYFILNTLSALSFLPYIPYIGKSSTKINLVPVDYIIRATVYLSLSGIGEGKTYHLTDPNPYSATQIYEWMTEAMYGKKPKGVVPISLCKMSLSIPMVRKFLHTEKETIDYFTWDGNFDCSIAASDLETGNIKCPDFKDGLDAMVRFYRQNQDNPSYQVPIR